MAAQLNQTLADELATAPMPPRRARLLAQHIASSLCAAHQAGIHHGRLSACNILLEGFGKNERAIITGFALSQTPAFMRSAAVQADIEAYGKILQAMLPEDRLAGDCLAPNLCDRPGSFDLILEELQDTGTRRTFIGGLLIFAAISGLYFAPAHNLANPSQHTHWLNTKTPSHVR
jgi:serine/threonine protein kinase